MSWEDLPTFTVVDVIGEVGKSTAQVAVIAWVVLQAGEKV